nr:MAG TPA: hypothetical protein [Bacteriophage sp.]
MVTRLILLASTNMVGAIFIPKITDCHSETAANPNS